LGGKTAALPGQRDREPSGTRVSGPLHCETHYLRSPVFLSAGSVTRWGALGKSARNRQEPPFVRDPTTPQMST